MMPTAAMVMKTGMALMPYSARQQGHSEQALEPRSEHDFALTDRKGE